MKLLVKKLHPDAIIPKYQTKGAAGFDVHALIKKDVKESYNRDQIVNVDYIHKDSTMGAVRWEENLVISLEPNSQFLVHTGLAFSVPEGYEMQIRPRSGLAAKHGITITNSPGTLDCVIKGTLIRTPSGPKKVEEIFEHSKITPINSYNEDNKKVEEDFVSDMWIVEDLSLIKITTEDNKSITIPFNKEVLTEQGWKKAKHITEEDKILSY